MQIKASFRFHLTPGRMTKIEKKLATNAVLDAERKNPYSLLVLMQTGASTMDISVEVPQRATI